jgi:protein-disulfide isomerase
MRIHLSRLFVPAFMLAFLATQTSAQGTQHVPASTLQAILAGPLATPPAGAAQPRVTLVVYFDYDCPVCRRLEPELHRLLKDHRAVRIIYKDWPIFGEASAYAAYCSFAAAREGKYRAAHDALIGSRPNLDSKQAVRSVLEGAGFDVQTIDADIEHHAKDYAEVLARNRREAAALGLHGTPGLIVGDRLVLGAVDYARLEQLVAEPGTTSH